uniref:Uncharacterized protein n=1 Tax=Anguilla anguilla TaxID=7936 RepID=A0A0E9TZJ0_ANGAN
MEREREGRGAQITYTPPANVHRTVNSASLVKACRGTLVAKAAWALCDPSEAP